MTWGELNGAMQDDAGGKHSSGMPIGFVPIPYPCTGAPRGCCVASLSDDWAARHLKIFRVPLIGQSSLIDETCRAHDLGIYST